MIRFSLREKERREERGHSRRRSSRGKRERERERKSPTSVDILEWRERTMSLEEEEEIANSAEKRRDFFC